MSHPLRVRRGLLRCGLWALASLTGLLLLAPATRAQAPTRAGATVDVVEISGPLDRATVGHVADTIAKAGRDRSEVVVVQLDTPGALGVSLDELVQTVAASPVPVVAWVGPAGARASGAGTVLAYAAHLLAVAPGATLGPAAPLELTAPRGPRASAAAEARLVAVALRRGRDVTFARSAAAGAQAVVVGSGAPEPPPPDAGHVETIQPRQLLERRIADVVAATLPDVLGQLDGRLVSSAAGPRRLRVDEDDASVRFHNLGLLRRVLHSVASPTLAYLLVVGGALALLFEAFQPGFGVAGATGVALAALGLYGLSVLAVSWAAFGLLVAGLVLLAADLALGRLGALTVGGTLALTVGSALLFDRSGLLRVSPWLVAAVVAGCLVFVVVVMTTVLRAQAGPPAADAEALVGKVGVVRSILNPQGHVFVAGALWRARAPEAVAPVRTGTRVRVVGCQDPPTLDVELSDESSVVA